MKEQGGEIRLKQASTPQMVLRQIQGWITYCISTEKSKAAG